MWLTLAREATLQSGPQQLKKNQWIIDLYDKAQAAANDGDKQMAAVYVNSYKNKKN